MKSPFIIKQDFLSPLTCESILKDIQNDQADSDVDGKPVKGERYCLKWEQEIIERFRELVPDIEERYNANYRGLEKPLFQFYPENAERPAKLPGCENSEFARKKWVKVKDVDLVGYVWLKDYNADVPLDPRHEVMGGKLEFPAYNFSLVPQRGTLIIMPAGPHFINTISPVMLGDLYQIKLTVSIKAKDGSMWFYQPSNFPGKWTDWLKEYM